MPAACPFPFPKSTVHFGVGRVDMGATKVWGKVALKPATKSKQVKWRLYLLAVWLSHLWSDTNRPPVRVGVEKPKPSSSNWNLDNNCARANEMSRQLLTTGRIRESHDSGCLQDRLRLRLSTVETAFQSLNASANSSQSDGGCLLSRLLQRRLHQAQRGWCIRC